MKNRRLGKFTISSMMIERSPEIVRAVMGRCIIVRCEMLFEFDALEYVAISPDFDEVQPGMISPKYDVITDNGDISFKRSNVKCTS